MSNFKKVSKQEFDAFIASYPRQLERHLLRLTQPERLQFCDKSLGVWPEFVVADYATSGGNPADIWAQVPGNWQVRSDLLGGARDCMSETAHQTD